jgi:Ca2+-binding EF-hand superfamily protein
MKGLGISLSIPEMQALMRKLDIDSDGSITEEELFNTLSQIKKTNAPLLSSAAVEKTLKKIAGGADDFLDMKGYAK